MVGIRHATPMIDPQLQGIVWVRAKSGPSVTCKLCAWAKDIMRKMERA